LLRIEPDGVMTPPLAGQPDRGRTAFVRRQPVRIVNGRFGGGYTGVFELICPGCGDDPYLDYTAVPPQLQWLRGPRALEAATHDEFVAAQEKGIPRIVLQKTGVQCDPQQEDFIKLVGDYGTGVFWDTFTDATDIQAKVIA
jgi:hypothetical protein